ncbi:hypothetical protein K503DRAFT_441661 [Rhizopogon vinicolor AM-OR11-026]|uniref:Uncharacterized protein n=1 Tax=Rhizopogon vinicolor AM-OR11-026 TaxID=1314800 RepID=A0A1B7NAC2_9AGAM|nr:hypothetical protein K503DRAFT_441661 [Rhizopogon vinicolor AM-OR11-026]
MAGSLGLRQSFTLCSLERPRSPCQACVESFRVHEVCHLNPVPRPVTHLSIISLRSPWIHAPLSGGVLAMRSEDVMYRT